MKTCSRGIVDPAKVVRAVLQGAASVAGVLIPGGGGMGGMGGMDY
jgi:chaperonin GroEL